MYGVQQLAVQVILYKQIIGYLRVYVAALSVEAGYQLGGANGLVTPFGEVSWAVFVPGGAEGAVGQKPVPVSVVE